MLPNVINHFSLGPFVGLVINGTVTLLCLVTLSFYHHYRPLRYLFFFFLVLTFFLFGWTVYGLQKSEESILLGYRILYASLAFIPACWGWFISSLLDEKKGWQLWSITIAAFIFAGLALVGQGRYCFNLPLKPHLIDSNILRPQSELLRPLIQSFSLVSCFAYLHIIIVRLWRTHDRRRAYLVPVAIGLASCFLGGLHDALYTAGIVLLLNDQILWLASLGLSIFLTIAVTIHFRFVERAAREELERLNKVKSKALNYLSHKIGTPLSVIRGNISHLKRRSTAQPLPSEAGRFFETIERQLNRLLHIQEETNKIIQSFQQLGEQNIFTLSRASRPAPILLYSFSEQIVKEIKQQSEHRDLHFEFEGSKDSCVHLSPKILKEVLEGLLKNAVENTPDEGLIKIHWEQNNGSLILNVQDFGVGIMEENQKYIFDGLFPTQSPEHYASKHPFDFNAGGKGLSLLQMKIYGQCFDFDLQVESRRCTFLPHDQNLCSGKISSCPHCLKREDCLMSGGSIFSLSFPTLKQLSESRGE